MVEIARSSREPRTKIAECFTMSPAKLSNWLKADESEDGTDDAIVGRQFFRSKIELTP